MYPPPTGKQLTLIRGDQDHDEARYDPEGKRLCTASKAGVGECRRDRDHADGAWDAGIHVTYDRDRFDSWPAGEEALEKEKLEAELAGALESYSRDKILDFVADVLDELKDRVEEADEERTKVDNQQRKAHYAGQMEGLLDGARALKDALQRAGFKFPEGAA